MRCGSIALVALAACSRGTVSLPSPSPDAASDAASPPEATADGALDAAPPVMLGAGTTWAACGELASAITAIAQSPDGKLLATGHGDGRVNLHRLDGSGAQTTVMLGAPLEGLAISADGQRVAALVPNLVAEHAIDGTFLRSLATGPGRGRSLQYLGGPTPLLLATTEPMGAPNVRIWNLTDAVPLRGFAGTALATFADGGKSVLQLDEAAGRMTIVPIEGGPSRSFSLPSAHLTPSPDGALVAGWMDGPGAASVKLSLFSTSDGAARWEVMADLHWIEGLVFLPAVRRLAVMTDDGATLFDLDSGRSAEAFPLDLFGRPERGFVVDAAADGGSLALVKPRDGRLLRVSTLDGSPLPSPFDFGISDEIFTFAAARTGQLLAASGGHGHTWILDPFDGRLRHFVSAEAAFKPDFSPDGSLFALAGDARAIFRMSDGMQISGVPPPPNVPSDYSWPGLVFSADARTLASGNDGKIELYDLDGNPLGTRTSQARAPGVAFSADGKWMATSGPELYPTGSDQRVWPAQLAFAPRAGDMRLPDDSVAFSPDGTLLLVSNAFLSNGTWKASTRVLKVDDGSLVRELPGLGRRPSFSPDGSWILGGKILVHLASGRRVALPEEISASTFLRNGSIAAATSSDRLVRLYCPVR